MMPFTPIAAKAIIVSIAMSSLAMAQAVPEEFTTARDVTIILPPIEEMECEEMDKVLLTIDKTRYRENAPAPHDPSDAPLFEYEVTLAEEHYNRCVSLLKNYSGGSLFIPRSKKPPALD